MSTMRFGVPLAALMLALAACGGDVQMPTDPVDAPVALAKGGNGGGGSGGGGGGGGDDSSPTDPRARFTLPTSGLDLLAVGAPAYEDGVCGVTSRIFATFEASHSGAAIMDTDNPASKPKRSEAKACGYPRRVSVVLHDLAEPATTTTVEGAGINVFKVHNTEYQIAIGEWRRSQMNLPACNGGVSDGDGLKFASEINGVTVAGDSVWVTRTGDKTWRVVTGAWNAETGTVDQGPGRAFCKATGVSYQVSVDFTIEALGDLP